MIAYPVWDVFISKTPSLSRLNIGTVITVFLLALVTSILGIIIGAGIAFRKQKGEYRYNQSSRQLGIAIMVVAGIVMVVYAVNYINYLNYKN